MITVIIDLSEDLPVDDRINYTRMIAGDFPCGYVDHEIVVNIDELQILIQLAQDDLTPEQEKHLRKFEYIRDCNTRPGPIQPDTTLECWQAEAIHDILANQITQLPSNGDHTRFYTECLESQQWHMTHHFMDLLGMSPMYAELTITQFSTDGTATQVALSHNEVDDLLTTLLQWRFNAARESHEAVTKANDNNLSDLDDGPIF